jgi:asparagine synthase (glutamine-hydrolysing)
MTNILVGETEKESLLNSDVYCSICRNRPGSPLDRLDYLSECVDKTDHINALTRILLETDLPSLLLRDADALGHAHGLQVDSPFLDPDLVNFVLTVPDHYKRRGKKEKILLRMIGSRFLPKDVTSRPKQGFFAPIGYWMRNELRPVVEDVLSPDTTKKRGLFNPEIVWSMYQDFQRNPDVPFFKLWLLTTLELWQRHFIDQSPEQSVPDPMRLYHYNQQKLMDRVYA